MKFSQKIGKSKVRDIVQRDSMDEKLKIGLWNKFYQHFEELLSHNDFYGHRSEKEDVSLKIWTDFLNRLADDIPLDTRERIYARGFINQLKQWYFSVEWYEIYDFIEFVADYYVDRNVTSFSEECNQILEKEMAAYRLVNGQVVPISSEEEISEIAEAVNSSQNWSSVQTHLKSAVHYFSNREQPDYRNSVKESISAVEALCVIITGDKNAKLGKALNQIEKKYKIHKALKTAFSALYGYTSDSGGIRHKLLEDDIKVSFEDAKFMLVSCSAFINYLKVKIDFH